ncbi:hypothetical protein [Streptomyces sp. NBC_00525]|uniref:hypothetical protein n=1 Tax=Streptomyces sp. NBC_00525 TaxID=2903660 RepID=UPI002E811F29|nr:hypothetical protein [Streptomyces sp. NBC_00525]WUC92268.1 hypothetical protein OG710_01010 [Streptomyces sp. NBC_00525]
MEVLVLVLCVALAYAAYAKLRTTLHRWKLPAPSISPAQLNLYQKQAFQEICRRSPSLGTRVRMGPYFDERQWNRADAMLVLAEPVKHKLVRIDGWRFGSYALTRKGWREYRKNFMWTGSGGDSMHITASEGGFAAVNINSPHGVAQSSGRDSTADLSGITYHQLATALKADAEGAPPEEAVRAREYAEDLTDAAGAQDADRANRILGRVNALLGTATSAFSLTRSLLPPGN